MITYSISHSDQFLQLHTYIHANRICFYTHMYLAISTLFFVTNIYIEREREREREYKKP